MLRDKGFVMVRVIDLLEEANEVIGRKVVARGRGRGRGRGRRRVIRTPLVQIYFEL